MLKKMKRKKKNPIVLETKHRQTNLWSLHSAPHSLALFAASLLRKKAQKKEFQFPKTRGLFIKANSGIFVTIEKCEQFFPRFLSKGKKTAKYKSNIYNFEMGEFLLALFSISSVLLFPKHLFWNVRRHAQRRGYLIPPTPIDWGEKDGQLTYYSISLRKQRNRIQTFERRLD